MSELHFANHDPQSPLFGAGFAALLAANPSFTGDQTDAFATYLESKVAGPDDGSILDRIATSAFRPHKRLLDHVARVIRHEPVFTLLDEQQVAFNAIMDAVGGAGQNQQSVAFLVKGGPGTGKSVIAVNLVAELSARGLRSLHLTGSKAFTENLRGVVGQRAGALFKYFRDTATIDEQLDVAVLDEAHRIRTVSSSRFTPAKHRTGKAQIDDILDATRVSVFFIDDLQVVRPGEVASTEMIREAAGKRGLEVREFELEAQFRSNVRLMRLQRPLAAARGRLRRSARDLARRGSARGRIGAGAPAGRACPQATTIEWSQLSRIPMSKPRDRPQIRRRNGDACVNGVGERRARACGKALAIAQAERRSSARGRAAPGARSRTSASGCLARAGFRSRGIRRKAARPGPGSHK